MSSVILVPSQAAPSESGVATAGENAVVGLPWRKPKPLPSSAGIRLRRLTSLRIPTSLMWLRAASGVTPIGTSSRMTKTSASMSMPQPSSASAMSSLGPIIESEAPWYISGSSYRFLGISAPRALRTNSTWLR